MISFIFLRYLISLGELEDNAAGVEHEGGIVRHTGVLFLVLVACTVSSEDLSETNDIRILSNTYFLFFTRILLIIMVTEMAMPLHRICKPYIVKNIDNQIKNIPAGRKILSCKLHIFLEGFFERKRLGNCSGISGP